MPIGPGKYDEAASAARAITGGAVVLLVIGGKAGHGFSVQCAPGLLPHLPRLLEITAAEIRESQARQN